MSRTPLCFMCIPCVECVFMFLYDVCSVVTSADERMSQVDDLIKMALVHSQLLQNESYEEHNINMKTE